MMMMMMTGCCRPMINNKLEEKTVGDGPNLSTMFSDDKNMQMLIENLQVCTHSYAQTFYLSSIIPTTDAAETGAINRLHFLAPVFRTIYVWNENFWHLNKRGCKL